MMRHSHLEHRFVQYIPEQLAEGVLYISMEYGTAAHSCCCGCGEQVVTPFTPTDWRMTYDGESVSLWPSIGNWMLTCRSHYVIDCGRVLEAGPWSDRQIVAERRRDHAAKARHYGTRESTDAAGTTPAVDFQQLPAQGLLSRVRRWTKRSQR
jgi:hypothetical protein